MIVFIDNPFELVQFAGICHVIISHFLLSYLETVICINNQYSNFPNSRSARHFDCWFFLFCPFHPLRSLNFPGYFRGYIFPWYLGSSRMWRTNIHFIDMPPINLEDSILKILFVNCRDICFEVLSYLFQNCCFSDSQSPLMRKEMRLVTYSWVVLV